jgi:protein-glutamine gamma-glutamyltransferase
MRDSTRILCLAMAATAIGLAAAATRHSSGRHIIPDSLSALPMDQVLLAALAGIVILLAVFSQQPRLQRLSCLVSTFLAIFASAVSGEVWLQAIVIGFAMLGVLWLMADYWQSLDDRLVAVHQKRLPRRWLFALPLAVLVILAAVPVGRRQIAALEGFMPSSGGRDRRMELATSGVGDGDNLVAGLENVQSFAPIEDAPFMTSHEPSLYDLFDDTYNEPVTVKRQQRAVSLPPQTQRLPENHRAASSQRAGSEFSLVRKPGRPTSPRIKDLPSQALFHVKGRLPLHLKLESFDLFDGVEWRPEPVPEQSPALSIQTVRGRPWLRIATPVDEQFVSTPETHALRIIHFDSNRIPSPNHLVGVHIADVAQADFFRWARPGLLRLDRQTFPELTTIHVQSRVVDPRRLATRTSIGLETGPEACRQFGDDPQSLAVQALVDSWVADLPHGWPQIERVVERIRGECAFDPEARASADTTHAVADFLLERRRGPDYLFASATVWALRSLGYSARLVSGFYVGPAAYEPRSGHAAAHAGDVHFWAEVAVGAGMWASLEPTPGYALLPPPPTSLEQLAAVVHAAAAWAARRPVATLFVLVASVLAIWQRLLLADLADRLLVRLWSWSDSRSATLGVLRLLDRRCTRAGLPRPRHRTPTTWLAELAAGIDAGDRPADGRPFLESATRALYMPPPDRPLSPDPETLDSVHRAAEAVWSWRNLRALATTGTPA